MNTGPRIAAITPPAPSEIRSHIVSGSGAIVGEPCVCIPK
jgi:hypothetical protein